MKNLKLSVYSILVALLSIAHIAYAPIKAPFPSAIDTYSTLNQDPANPFVISYGTSMSQARKDSANTANSRYIRSQLQKIAQKQSNPKIWLSHSNHIWYVLNALPIVICNHCNTQINPKTLTLQRDCQIIDDIINDISSQKSAKQLTMAQCPTCKHKNDLTELPSTTKPFTDKHKHAMTNQFHALNILSQPGCKTLPVYRLSVEASDVLQDGTTNIDPKKLHDQAQFLASFGGNLVVFGHHYSNPQVIPNLFEKSAHIPWFANYCAQVVQSCPRITHFCPISQPIAFSFHLARSQDLPPFICSINQKDYLANMTQAHVAACIAIKKVNPNIQVLVCHQWKPMRAMHTDIRSLLESFICSVADKKYNGEFVKQMKPYEKYFDGIALSIYPPVTFNLFWPQGTNCSDILDADAALEAIVQTHKHFPTKDIYVTETGCNTTNPEKKRQFIDMMLHVCLLARNKGIPVKGIYFWAHTNDPDFYSEWNAAPGSTHFAPFDKLDTENPANSINASGTYIQEILRNNQ